METLDLHSRKNEKFQPTPEELEAIKKKMDDPEFMKLWAEYAQELQDPKYREEEEAYLRQIEKEAQEGGDYTFEFIFPEPVFAVELKSGNRKRAFLNLCRSEKVEQFSESKATDSNDASWHVPVVVGKSREEHFDNSDVEVFDCVFHPKTVELATFSDRFLCFLVEIAVENVNGGYNRSFGFQFSRLPSSCKSVGTPQNQTIRKKGTDSSFFPKSHEPPASRPQAPSPVVPSRARPPAPSPPKYSVVHRGELDLTDAWQWRSSDKRIGVPKELVVKFSLPNVAKASELDVDVREFAVDVIATDAGYNISAPLPFSVDTTPVSARFDKSRHELSLVLSVIPPARPEAPESAPTVSAPETPATGESLSEPQLQVEPQPQADSPSTPAESDDETRDRSLSHCVNSADPTTGTKDPVTESTTAASDSADAVKDVMARVAEARRAREEAERRPDESKGQPELEKSPEQEVAARADGDSTVDIVDLRSAKKHDEGPVVLDDDEMQDPRAILEAQKQLRAEREAERVATELAKKMSDLPLCSRHIFAIE